MSVLSVSSGLQSIGESHRVFLLVVPLGTLPEAALESARILVDPVLVGLVGTLGLQRPHLLCQ